MKRVYLDYAASTPIDKRVSKVAKAAFLKFGNPGSLHFWGQESISLIDQSRQKSVDFLGCQFNELIFTSGATESNNLAIRGVVKYFKDQKVHIVSTAIEHKSVLETLKDLENEGVEVSYVKPNKFGLISALDVISKVKDNTVLVSVMAANNETGVIQPIKEIGEGLKDKKNIFSFFPIFHSDITQLAKYMNGDIYDLGVDLASFSGHKLSAFKGVGGLYIKSGTKILPILSGGSQEFKKRPGTENILGIVSLAKALEILKEEGREEEKKVNRLKQYFLKELKKIKSDFVLNSGQENILAHIVNIRFKGEKSDELLVKFDLEGLAVSAGSACTSRALIPSHVLLSMGLSEEEVRESIRFSFGRETTKRDLNMALRVIKKVLGRF